MLIVLKKNPVKKILGNLKKLQILKIIIYLNK